MWQHSTGGTTTGLPVRLRDRLFDHSRRAITAGGRDQGPPGLGRRYRRNGPACGRGLGLRSASRSAPSNSDWHAAAGTSSPAISSWSSRPISRRGSSLRLPAPAVSRPRPSRYPWSPHSVSAASTVPGRSALLDGFGLIAFASLSPMMTVMAYAQLSEWRTRQASQSH